MVGAFTATATGEVRTDIIRLLGLRDPYETVTGFDRPNLFFDVVTAGADKYNHLLRVVTRNKGRSGIVYCSTRKLVEEVCDNLCSEGFRATRYHAGLEKNERDTNQEDFIYERCDIMVATNAFGMGIDKSNVSYVVPQRLSHASIHEGRELTFFFRVRTPLESPTFFLEGITEAGEVELIKRKKARIAVPAEMEQIKLEASTCAGFAEVRVRVEGGQ